MTEIWMKEKRWSRTGFRRSTRKSTKIIVERNWRFGRRRKRDRRGETQEGKKRYKRRAEKTSQPSQKTANNHCHNRPNYSQDNTPNKQKFSDFRLAE
jgi:hypothetical protein